MSKYGSHPIDWMLVGIEGRNPGKEIFCELPSLFVLI